MKYSLLFLYFTVLALSGPGEARHDFHVSMARMAIENNQAVIQIRLFKDDLEAGLQHHFEDPGLKLEDNARIDSMFALYLNAKLLIEQDGNPLKGSIADKGEEELFGFPVKWYTLTYASSIPLAILKIDHQVLMEMFDDQQNVLRVTRFPSEDESMYYFVAGASQITLDD